MHTQASELPVRSPISTAEILRACICGLIETQQWALAARYAVALDRIERAPPSQPPRARPSPVAAPAPAPVTPATAKPKPEPDPASISERNRQLRAATIAAQRASLATPPAEDGSVPPPPEVLELARLLDANPPFT